MRGCICVLTQPAIAPYMRPIASYNPGCMPVSVSPPQFGGLMHSARHLWLGSPHPDAQWCLLTGPLFGTTTGAVSSMDAARRAVGCSSPLSTDKGDKPSLPSAGEKAVLLQYERVLGSWGRRLPHPIHLSCAGKQICCYPLPPERQRNKPPRAFTPLSQHVQGTMRNGGASEVLM